MDPYEPQDVRDPPQGIGRSGVDPLGPVFISYRQSDGTHMAVALAWALRAAGVPVWHDRTDLPPGDTAQRLKEALASGLSGALLVVTPEIAASTVVREVELPALLELAKDPEFTFSIVSTVEEAKNAGRLDYTAPDRLLATTPGTLSAIDQRPVATRSQRTAVARAQARRRVEHARAQVLQRGGELVLDLQTRIPPYASRTDGHLVVRLRPPVKGQRRPHPTGLHDLQEFLGEFPQLLAIAGASRLLVRGGAHLSVACALGAAVPTTLLGTVEVTDTAGASWQLTGQATPGSIQLIGPVQPPAESDAAGPVLAYVDLIPERSDAAFDDFVSQATFASVVHLRALDGRLLESDDAPALVGQVAAALRGLAGSRRTSELHLLLRCPYPLAILLGRTLNTLTVHLYEWEHGGDDTIAGPRYVPSLILRSGAGGSPIHEVTAPPTTDSDEEH